MARGAVLVGCGFVPSEADVQAAANLVREKGRFEVVDVITTIGYPAGSQLNAHDAVAIYFGTWDDKGWEGSVDDVGFVQMRIRGRIVWYVGLGKQPK